MATRTVPWPGPLSAPHPLLGAAAGGDLDGSLALRSAGDVAGALLQA